MEAIFELIYSDGADAYAAGVPWRVVDDVGNMLGLGSTAAAAVIDAAEMIDERLAAAKESGC